MFSALKEYNDNHGDCNVPLRWTENKQLGLWAGVQRRSYRKGKLSKNRIKCLEEMGFVWNPIDSQWEEMFTKLKEYKNKRGDCNVSKHRTENKQLGLWVSRQRSNYRKGQLTEERIKRLEDIGFVWTPPR
jgi:hypothetical protein